MDFPMNGEMLNLIDCTVKKAVSETVAGLKKSNLIVDGRQSPFQKTETLLFNYKNFLSAIKDKQEQIEELKQYGIRKHTSSGMCGNTGFIEVKSDAEKAEEKIELIQYSIQTTRNFIKIIDDALDSLKLDPYYDLIPMRYFENKTREDIAEHFDCDVSTVNRNKNRLINLLQIRLFSDEVIESIFFS